MQKKETTFSNRLHKTGLFQYHIEKTNNPFRRGTPDFYYEGPQGLLWAEHKWEDIPIQKYRPPEKLDSSKSWPLQLAWLRRAHSNHKPTAVIIGLPKGGYWIEYPFEFDPKKHSVFTDIELRAKITILLSDQPTQVVGDGC